MSPSPLCAVDAAVAGLGAACAVDANAAAEEKDPWAAETTTSSQDQENDCSRITLPSLALAAVSVSLSVSRSVNKSSLNVALVEFEKVRARSANSRRQSSRPSGAELARKLGGSSRRPSLETDRDKAKDGGKHSDQTARMTLIS